MLIKKNMKLTKKSIVLLKRYIKNPAGPNFGNNDEEGYKCAFALRVLNKYGLVDFSMDADNWIATLKGKWIIFRYFNNL